MISLRQVASRCKIPPLYRHASSFVVKRPSPSATRLAPTPLVFCSAEGWGPRRHTILSACSSALAETGFTCIESCFTRPSGLGATSTSEELVRLYSNELKAKLQTLGYPFPPVVFASDFASLIAQTYVSSYPAQGLFLVSPPLSNASLYPDVLPTPLPEFNYELQFPVAVMATRDYMSTVKAQSRFTRSAWVDLVEVENLEGDRAIKEVGRWVDELGDHLFRCARGEMNTVQMRHQEGLVFCLRRRDLHVLVSGVFVLKCTDHNRCERLSETRVKYIRTVLRPTLISASDSESLEVNVWIHHGFISTVTWTTRYTHLCIVP